MNQRQQQYVDQRVSLLDDDAVGLAVTRLQHYRPTTMEAVSLFSAVPLRRTIESFVRLRKMGYFTASIEH